MFTQVHTYAMNVLMYVHNNAMNAIVSMKCSMRNIQ